MGVNKFTAEQIEKLKENPYVESVTDKYINYSEIFKELPWTEVRPCVNRRGKQDGHAQDGLKDHCDAWR